MDSHSVVLIKNVIFEAVQNENVEIKANKISTEGANYMGELYLLDVKEEGKDPLKLFAKVSNTPAEARGFISANQIYKNEVIMYTKITDELNSIQEKHDVPEEKRFLFPKYYGSNLKELEEVVVLENLADKGYEMYDRFKPLNWEFARVAVEELAKFHALSFALKKEHPQKFEIFSKILTNHFFGIPGDGYKQLLDIARTKAVSVDDENKARVYKFIDDFETKLDFIEHSKPTTQYSVIIHGDYRSSNMLVKYEGDSITSLVPIDYQTASYGNPVSDLIYLLFTGTDEKFRKDYFEQFIEHYHNSLKDFLQLLSHDINDIYPKSAFYFELKDRLIYGLEIAFFLLPTVLVEPEDKVLFGDFVNVDAVFESFVNMKSSDVFVERLNGIVRDFIRWDMLPEAERPVQNGTTDHEVEQCSEKLKSAELSDE